MKQTLLSFTCFLIGLGAIECSAQTNQIFIPNFGQILTTDSTQTARSFYASIPGGTAYFSEDTVSFVYALIDTSEATDDTLYRFDMRFISPFSTPAFRGTDTSEFYYNFYYPHCDTGITGVRLFSQLDVDELWQGVDLTYISTGDGYITRFTVAPEWGTSAIQWQFDGLDSAKIGIIGELQLYTPLGTFFMPPPIAYSGNDTFTAIYTRSGSSFGMAQQGWSGLQPMHFEWSSARMGGAGPCGGNCEWSTYYGGAASETFHDSHTDASNNLYLVGTTTSSNLPIFMAYQGQNAGSWDAVVIKFNEQGVREWATYFGGTLTDFGRGVTTDPSGDVFVTGYTSSEDLPTATPGGGAYYEPNISVAWDIFMLKLTSNGQDIPWSTYYGGNHHDEAHAIASDAAGNVFITGRTRSTNFPVNDPGGGAYFQSTLAGPAGSDMDAFVIKINTALDDEWATYYGGPNSFTEQGNDIAIDNSGNVFVIGTTTGSSLPVHYPGSPAYIDSFLDGSADAFILGFTNNGVPLWATYFGGSDGEHGLGIASSAGGDIFVCGDTDSDDFPTQASGPAYYEDSRAGDTDAYIARFGADLSIGWSTYYGGGNRDNGVDLAVASNGSLHLCGSSSSNDLPFRASAQPPNTYNQSYQGSRDAYVAIFGTAQEPLWGTYVGGTNQDEGFSVSVDGNAKLFLIGRTRSGFDFPLNDGGGIPYYQGVFGGDDDASITRLDLSPVLTGVSDVLTSASWLSAHPNPTSGFLNITISLNDDGRLAIFNLMGQAVEAIDIDSNVADPTLVLDLSRHGPGVYLVNFQSASLNISQRVILQ